MFFYYFLFRIYYRVPLTFSPEKGSGKKVNGEERKITVTLLLYVTKKHVYTSVCLVDSEKLVLFYIFYFTMLTFSHICPSKTI